MRISKKVFLAIFIFLTMVVGISAAIICPMLQREMGNNLDSNLRAKLAGSIDFLVVGASHAENGFNMQIIDKKLRTHSYNLSSSMLTTKSKIFLLKKEVSRNPVKTVIFELSFDTLERDEDKELGAGDVNTVLRSDNIYEAFCFMIGNMAINDWAIVYARALINGRTSLKSILLNRERDFEKIIYENKGSFLRPHLDVSLKHDEIVTPVELVEILAINNNATFQRFDEMIRFCQSNNIRPVVVVVPVSDAIIFQRKGWDKFKDSLSMYCIKKHIEFYDFNLIKNRYSVFSDKISFADTEHLSETGANDFSNIFCEIMLLVAQEKKVDAMFYHSYEEMKKDSSYCK